MSKEILKEGFAYQLFRLEDDIVFPFNAIYIGDTVLTNYVRHDCLLSDRMEQIGQKRHVFIDTGMKNLFIIDDDIVIEKEICRIINIETVLAITQQSELFSFPVEIKTLTELTEIVLKTQNNENSNEKHDYSFSSSVNFNLAWLSDNAEYGYFINDLVYEYDHKIEAYYYYEPKINGFSLKKNQYGVLIFSEIEEVKFNDFATKYKLATLEKFSFDNLSALKNYYFDILRTNNFQSYIIQNYNNTINLKYRIEIDRF